MERAPYVCESRGRSTGHRGAERSAPRWCFRRTVEKFEFAWMANEVAVSGRWLRPYQTS